MKALIIYDDRTAKTSTMLHRAADNSDRIVRWNISSWHMEMLKRSSSASQALMEAADTHLIVIVLRSAEKLPDWLMGWLEQWAKGRLTFDAALALICEGEADILLAPAKSDLSLFAKRHNLSFISGDGDEAEDRPEFLIRSLFEREMTLSPALFRIADVPMRDSYRVWDINE
jgi:hypothetical protein